MMVSYSFDNLSYNKLFLKLHNKYEMYSHLKYKKVDHQEIGIIR